MWNALQQTKLHTFLLHKIVEPAENKDFQSLLASFRASGGVLKKKITSNIFAKNNNKNPIFQLKHINWNFFFSPKKWIQSNENNRMPNKQVQPTLQLNTKMRWTLIITNRCHYCSRTFTTVRMTCPHFVFVQMYWTFRFTVTMTSCWANFSSAIVSTIHTCVNHANFQYWDIFDGRRHRIFILHAIIYTQFVFSTNQIRTFHGLCND